MGAQKPHCGKAKSWLKDDIFNWNLAQKKQRKFGMMQGPFERETCKKTIIGPLMLYGDLGGWFLILEKSQLLNGISARNAEFS